MKALNNQFGNMPVLLLGSMMMLGSSYLAGSHFRFDHANQLLKHTRMVAARDSLVEQIRQVGELPAAYRASIFPELSGANAELRECLARPGGCALSEGTDYPLDLHILSGDQLNRTTGNPNTPARYNLEGKVCSSQERATMDCPFEVITSFRVQCAASPCTDPSFQVSYEIRLSPDLPDAASHFTSVTRVSGISNPVSYNSIYPPNSDFEPRLLRTVEMIVSTPVNNTPAVDPNRPTNPVLRALYDAGHRNDNFYEAVLRSQITDSEMAVNIFEAIRWGRRTVSTELITEYIEAWQRLGPEVATAIFQNRDLRTPEKVQEMSDAVAPVVNRDLAVAFVRNNIRDPASITEFTNTVADITNPDIISIIVGANLRDRTYAQTYAAIHGELEWMHQEIGEALIEARVTSERVARMARDSWFSDPAEIRIIEQSGITRSSVAEAVVHSMPDPTVDKAVEFNRLIGSSGTRDWEVIHRAAAEQVTTVAEIEALESSIAEERRLAEIREQQEQEAAEAEWAQIEEVNEQAPVEVISGVMPSGGGSGTQTTVVSETQTQTGGGGSVQGGSGGGTQTTTSELVSGCGSRNCVYIPL